MDGQDRTGKKEEDLLLSFGGTFRVLFETFLVIFDPFLIPF
jgi:hypothetical protein